MIYQINKLPEDRLKSSPKTSRKYMIQPKNQKGCTFLHLIDTLNDLNWLEIALIT